MTEQPEANEVPAVIERKSMTTLFLTAPSDLTMKDLDVMIAYYRNKRLIMEAGGPAAVRKSNKVTKPKPTDNLKLDLDL